MRKMSKSKKIVSFILTLIMMVSAAIPASAQYSIYPDAAGHWAREQIEALTEAGIVHGYPDGTVRPDRTITQAEYAVLLSNAAGLKTEESAADSYKGSWAVSYASALEAAGAFEDTGYDAEAPITRLEMLIWSLRAMGGTELSEKYRQDTGFSDDDALSLIEKGYVGLAAKSGLIYGYPDGSIRPQATSTRAEAFAIIYRYEAAKEYVDQEKRPVNTGRPPVINSKEMVVSLDGPDQAETHKPVEIKVIHKNMSRLVWEVKGYNPDIPIDSAAYTHDLDEDGGTIEFYDPGQYELIAHAYDANDKEAQYTLSIHVEEADIWISAPRHVNLYMETMVNAHVREGITNLQWSVTKNGDSDNLEGYSGNLFENGGLISFYQKGIYQFTLVGMDGSGKSYSASTTIDAYTEPYGALFVDPTAYVGQNTNIGASHFTPDEDMTIEWQVLENGEVQDWDEVIDGHIDNVISDTIKFRRPGDFTIRMLIKDSLGHTFQMECRTKVYIPLEYSIDLPETAYIGDEIEITTDGLDKNHQDVTWKARINGTTYDDFKEYIEAIEEPLDYQGGKVRFNTTGNIELELSVPDVSGKIYAVSCQIQIYPKVGVDLQMPDSTWVGADVGVQAVYDYNDDNLVPIWAIKKDGAEVKAEDVLIGSLSGGMVSFLQPGSYEITTSVTDVLGTTFSDTKTIVVTGESLLPEPVFTAPKYSYVSQEIQVGFTQDLNRYNVEWTYKKDGMEGAEAEFVSGRLNEAGGKISCGVAGEYELIATVKGEDGQEKSYSKSITIKNTPVFKTYLFNRPLHVGDGVGCRYDLIDAEGTNLSWKLYWNGTEVKMSDYAYFEVMDSQFNIQFKETGSYCLEAILTDGYGNEFKYPNEVFAPLNIWPHIISCPDPTYPNTPITIEVDAKNRTDEEVVWKLYWNGEQVALDEHADYNLGPAGGTITFKNYGSYTLKAELTDKYGKTMHDTVDITVMN